MRKWEKHFGYISFEFGLKKVSTIIQLYSIRVAYVSTTKQLQAPIAPVPSVYC